MLKTNPNPSGLCMCGCGQPTKIAKADDARKGAVKGCPRRFVIGHGRRAATLDAWEVDAETGCWIWTGPRHDRKGYGRVLRDGRQILAHRWVYEREVGPIPEGMHLHHECERPSCVNPAHLRPTTNSEHMSHHRASEGPRERKTHCKHGHPLSGENLYVTAKGWHMCRACGRENKRRARARAT
jgi:hypothetical protein